MTKNYIGNGDEFKTLKEAEGFTLRTASPLISYDGIFQTSNGYSEWYIWKDSPNSLAKKFMQNPNRKDLNSPHTRTEEDILKLWIMREDGKYLNEPKLVWTKKKGQINQKQKPEPTLEETIKNYLKRQRI